MGKSENFKQVFGTNPYLWFLPVYTTMGNGLTFPRKDDHGESNNDFEEPNTDSYSGDSEDGF